MTEPGVATVPELRRAGELARALSDIERGGSPPPGGGPSGAVVGLVGPPGVGKSTLISQLVGRARARGERVVVLAVDPSSPLTGGALLGDRIRLHEHVLDPGVFVRSFASRGHPGGLAAAVPDAITAAFEAGWDRVFIEPVGGGQNDVEVAACADRVVLVLSPEAGDDVQALKAGVLEVADIIAINKADRPGAAELRARLGSRSGAVAAEAIVLVSAQGGGGLDDLDALTRADSEDTGVRREVMRRTALVNSAVDRLNACLADPMLAGEVTELLAAGRRAEAVTRLLEFAAR